MMFSSFFSRPWLVFGAATALRIGLLIYGRWQDANSPIKYTDIDYLVFTDAARFVSRGRSPYDRATYRYTPWLAWLLLPTTWHGVRIPNHVWFDFGKALFAAGDIVTGWLIMRLLMRHRGMSAERAMKFSSLWLLNPMAANISTRGSSEGLLAVIVVGVLWAVLDQNNIRLAGCFLGIGVAFKIYPFIYAASLWWFMSDISAQTPSDDASVKIRHFFNKGRLLLARDSLIIFTLLTLPMYRIYGYTFVDNTFMYHLTRIDHRHNFSVYNTALHLSSAYQHGSLKIESFAFLPQLFLSVGLIPYLLARRDLAGTMLAQTFAFVTFNKYFLWYMVFLPFYLPDSTFLRNPKLGTLALSQWVAGQALWLYQGYGLEFLGKSTFVPGLWLASIWFFLVNCWILGVIVSDIGSRNVRNARANPYASARASEKKSR